MLNRLHCLHFNYYLDYGLLIKKFMKNAIGGINKKNMAGLSYNYNECDYVGPPHKTANIRLIKFCKSDDESPLETLYRQKREETQEWNIAFWSHHNSLFQKEKSSFIEEKLKEKYGNEPVGTEPKYLSAEEMSVFYKNFLEKHHLVHVNYNKDWYKKNFENLILAARVVLQKIFLKRKSVNPS